MVDLTEKRKRNAEASARWRAKNPDKVHGFVLARMERRKTDPAEKARYDASQRKWYEGTRAMIDAIKLERGCADCGYREHAEALDFDHRDPSAKLFNVGLVNQARGRLLDEIAKCDVRCANCHRIKTKNERMEQALA